MKFTPFLAEISSHPNSKKVHILAISLWRHTRERPIIPNTGDINGAVNMGAGNYGLCRKDPNSGGG